MSSIGPQLPPHLAKRKRTPEAEDEDDNASSSSTKHPRREPPAQPQSKNQHEIDLDDSDSDSDDMGSAAPAPARVSGPSRPIAGPSLPPPNKDQINLSSDSDSDTGPPPPPPQTADAESSSDSEDDFGPSLPSASLPRTRPIGPSLPAAEADAPKRDEWMLAPPPSSTTFSERDTTRIRARKFASKPSSAPAPGAGGGLPSIWTETPEEKLRRLQDAVLGRSAPDGSAAGNATASAAGGRDRKREERDANIAASIEAQRGRSLLEEHQKRRDGGGGAGGRKDEEEDDPSKRAFDREKDMALGGSINTTQRRQLINKSANFGGRFQKGSYL